MTPLQRLSPGDEQAVATKLNAVFKNAGVNICLPPASLRIGKKGTILFCEIPLLSANVLAQFGIQRPEDIDIVGCDPAFVKALVSALSENQSHLPSFHMLQTVFGESVSQDVSSPETYPFIALRSVGYSEKEIARHLAGWKVVFLPGPRGGVTCKLEREGTTVEWRMSKDWRRFHYQKPYLVEYALQTIERLNLELPRILADAVQEKFTALHKEISFQLSDLHFDELKRDGLVSQNTVKKAASWVNVTNCGVSDKVSFTVKPPRHLVAGCPICHFSARFDVVDGQFETKDKLSEAWAFCKMVLEETERRRKYKQLIWEFRRTWETLGRGLADEVNEMFVQNPWVWLPPVKRFLAQACDLESDWQAGDIEVSGSRLKLGGITFFKANSPAAVKEEFVLQAAALVQRLNANGCLEDSLRVRDTSFSFAEIKKIIKAVAHHPNYGASTIAMLLTGSKSKKLSDLGLRKSQHYGALSARKQVDVLQAIEVLTQLEVFKVQHKFYHDLPVLTVSAEAKEWANRNEPVVDRQLSGKEALETVLAAGDQDAVAALIASDPALEFYLKAAVVLVPYGKAAKMAKKVLSR